MLAAVWLCAVLAIATTAHADDASAGEPPRLTPHVMYVDPAIVPRARGFSFHPDHARLLLRALDQPDTDTRMQAASTIGRAYAHGLTELRQSATPRLLELALDKDQPLRVRLHAVEALGRFDDAAVAPRLVPLLAEVDDLVLSVDTLLTRWIQAQWRVTPPRFDSAPMEEAWRQRVADGSRSVVVRQSAMRQLDAVNMSLPNQAARTLLTDATQPITLQLAIARAHRRHGMGSLHELAQTLATGTRLQRLLAATLASPVQYPPQPGTTAAPPPPQDARSAQLLLRLADDADPAVAAQAVRNLRERDARTLAPVAARLSEHRDPAVRQGAAVGLRHQVDPDAVGVLIRLLDDVSPSVRAQARESLRELAGHDALRSQVEQAGITALAGSWRQAEQAALLMLQIDHAPTAERIAALLTHERWETRMAAIVALRELKQSSTYPTMLARLQQLRQMIRSRTEHHMQSTRRTGPDVSSRLLSEEMAALLQALGVVGYEPVGSEAMQYVPKGSGFEIIVREAGVWALGRLHSGTADAQATRTLLGRLTDENPMDPEAPEIRIMAAIALGHMKATQAAERLRRYATHEMYYDELAWPSRWALHQIVGEAIEPVPPSLMLYSEAFLQPVR